jgi:hypothetical protein
MALIGASALLVPLLEIDVLCELHTLDTNATTSTRKDDVIAWLQPSLVQCSMHSRSSTHYWASNLIGDVIWDATGVECWAGLSDCVSSRLRQYPISLRYIADKFL